MHERACLFLDEGLGLSAYLIVVMSDNNRGEIIRMNGLDVLIMVADQHLNEGTVNKGKVIASICKAVQHVVRDGKLR